MVTYVTIFHINPHKMQLELIFKPSYTSYDYHRSMLNLLLQKLIPKMYDKLIFWTNTENMVTNVTISKFKINNLYKKDLLLITHLGTLLNLTTGQY